MNKLRILRVSYKRFKRNMHTTNGKEILVEKLSRITTIGINRPDKRNSVDFKTAKLLKNAIEEFEKDSNSYVAVIYGTGGNFCSGFDFNEIAELENPSESLSSLERGFMDFPSHIKKPTIAAVNGYAVAGGLDLALLCDLRVMEETAILGLYSRRFGIPITDGATVKLQAMIGLSRALDMILTGRSLNAEEALQWGIANRIVACGTALGQAINLASSLTKFPQECLNVDRMSTYNSAYGNVFDELLQEERKNSKKVSVNSIVEGAKKFLSGLGRHGKTYNLTERTVCDWEKEFNTNNSNKPKSKL
ncbi:2,3-dehydroadipyl-CoA hydratase-like [Diorhabda sublineata]|uniref:2,3-dehydroadipyl-CoA hydratase-like n=1 Tax=Diorhabda sublineata TaxID=1163346 RepID=UPI0024E09E03|nr:2,3-dehydroadipyl-CoA hydratase-like [Diorhabda sublineata]